MSRALGETVIQDALGNVITGCTIDLLDPSTGLRVTVPVYADDTSATTLTLPFVSLDGKVSFYLAIGQLVTVQATKSGVTATETITVVDPTQTGSVTGGNPTGIAGGDLAGSAYPNPVVAPGAITAAKLAAGAATGAALGTDVATLTGTQTLTNKTLGTGTVLPAGSATGAVLGTDVATKVAGIVPIAQLATGTPTGAKFISDAGTLLVPSVSSASLATLTDATITSPADGDTLAYKTSVTKWQNYPRPERPFEFFGGSKTASSIQTAAWTAARAWADGLPGGSVFFSAGTYPHMPKLELGNHMKIRGAGLLATRLQFDASITTGACVFNHVSTNGTSDPNAWGCAVESLTIDCSLLPGWGTNAVNGITWNQNPTFTHATADAGELILNDTGHVVRDVLVYQPPQDGVVAQSMGSQHWEQVLVYSAGRYGFQPPFDSLCVNLTAGFSAKEGFLISGNPMRLVGCKAFSSGNITHANGQGFHIVPGGGLAPITLVGCEAQDNFAAGFFVDGASSSEVGLIGCFADSNSVRGVGTDPGFDILNSPNTQLIGCRASERNANGVNQIHAVSLRGTSTSVHVEIQHKGTNSATVSSPFQAIDSTAGASFVSVNNLQGFLANVSATITPDFFAGSTIETLGLAGNATVNAPINGPYPPGTLTRFIFKQNGTGGFTITWNAAFVNTPTTNTAANGYTIGRFVYDGTSWVGV